MKMYVFECVVNIYLALYIYMLVITMYIRHYNVPRGVHLCMYRLHRRRNQVGRLIIY